MHSPQWQGKGHAPSAASTCGVGGKAMLPRCTYRPPVPFTTIFGTIVKTMEPITMLDFAPSGVLTPLSPPLAPTWVCYFGAESVSS